MLIDEIVPLFWKKKHSLKMQSRLCLEKSKRLRSGESKVTISWPKVYGESLQRVSWAVKGEYSLDSSFIPEEKAEEIPDLDDTDGLDPAGEFDAWRLRELGRIKKEKEKEALREEEREEVERRRALPEEQRNKEDIARAQKLRDEKPKNSSKFLQKYYHKGAFYQVLAFFSSFPPNCSKIRPG